MKVENEAIRALLLQQSEAHRKPQTGSGLEGFDALLSAQMQQSGKAQAGQIGLPGQAGAEVGIGKDQNAASLALLLQSSEMLGGLEGKAGEQNSLEALATGRIDSLLGQWEGYASALQNGNGNNLRSLYDMLQGMSAEVKELKANLPDLLQNNAALGSLVNELDVLTTTETIKFNRGDYL